MCVPECVYVCGSGLTVELVHPVDLVPVVVLRLAAEEFALFFPAPLQY